MGFHRGALHPPAHTPARRGPVRVVSPKDIRPMATWCSPTAAPRRPRLQARSRSPQSHPRVIRRLDTEAALCLDDLLDSCASRPLGQTPVGLSLLPVLLSIPPI